MPEYDRVPADVTHTTLSILFLGLLVVSTFWVLSPFLTAILWAVIVCITTWPILLRLEGFFGRRWAAVATMTAAILLLIFIPVTSALITIVRNAQNITTEIKSFESIALPAAPQWLEHVPFGGEQIAGKWTRFAALDPRERSAAMAPYVQAGLQWFIVKAGGIGKMLVQFVLAAIISAIGLGKGESVRDGILRFATRLGGPQGYDAALLAARTIRGVVLGVVGTALIQAAIGGTGLLIAGVPAAGLLTAMMLFLCLAQLGPLPLLVPILLWLFWAGRTGSGVTVLVVAVLAGTLDNVIRPVLIKRGVDLPLVLIFAGVIGGLIAFGIIGLFIGPVVLSVAHTLLSAWIGSPRALAANRQLASSRH